jgi:hypothetical protein
VDIAVVVRPAQLPDVVGLDSTTTATTGVLAAIQP